MRFKSVPSPPPEDRDELAALASVRDALPIVPRSEADCCARVIDRVAWIDERDVASEWIAFLRALALAERQDAGYTRVCGDIDREAVATHFRERILGTETAVAALDDATEPRNATAVFDAIEAEVPEWERRRTDSWHETWLAHTERVLAWAALLGLAERRVDGYVRASPR